MAVCYDRRRQMGKGKILFRMKSRSRLLAPVVFSIFALDYLD